MNANSLSGKTAIVTGTASGIGRSVAVMLANNGAKVFGGDIAPDSGDDTTFTDLGITTTNCDVTAEQDVIRLIEMAAAQSGKIDILVNNAGVGMVKQIPEVSEDDWDYCMGVNLKGPFLLFTTG